MDACDLRREMGELHGLTPPTPLTTLLFTNEPIELIKRDWTVLLGSSDVLFACDRFEMPRIDTPPDITEMVELETVWNRTEK